MTMDEFEQVVCDALDALPERFASALDNVQIAVEDEPDPDLLAGLSEDDGTTDQPLELFGLYDGVSLPERAAYGYGLAEVPDVITVFKGPHERASFSRDEIVHEVRKTVIHEIGHYFGLSDERLEEMGY